MLGGFTDGSLTYTAIRSSGDTTVDTHIRNLLVSLPILFVWFFALAITIHALARVAASLRRGPVAS